MVWNKGDVWTAEVRGTHAGVTVKPVSPTFSAACIAYAPFQGLASPVQVELPVNTKIEYKYVILEEQVQPRMLDSKTSAGPRSTADAFDHTACNNRPILASHMHCAVFVPYRPYPDHACTAHLS